MYVCMYVCVYECVCVCVYMYVFFSFCRVPVCQANCMAFECIQSNLIG